ncbi:ornithine cyclodeaminase family protein [Bordetella sp. BOR01]|uniref:ornithine cyclodeaminase family protein n=1 Tax=Bordetella sp. BOR01 TaxID=2854779 RepID=UPI001C466C39|nr:ornithine cyclodeaminase family protein [Bordetella sp. BOR01]MBV7482201.1 ornithine cyclodeaminase family protein [Bordetella sp. BOR01]
MRFVKEEEVVDLFPLEAAIDCVERAFRDYADGVAFDVPRERTKTQYGSLHILQAASEKLNVIGYKAYYPGRERRVFLVHIMNLRTGRLEGIVEGDEMGIRRTGAATAVATRALARADARTLACFGTGRHGLTQLRAVCAVRPIERVQVYGRTLEHLQAFRAEVEASSGVSVTIAATPEAALNGADIVNIVTRADTPLFDGALLAPGQHVNAVGSNALNRREIDLAAVRAADLVVVDSVEVARRECGDLLPAIEAGLLHWRNVPDLGGVLTGRAQGRVSERQITLFESQGMGVQDIYAGKYVLEAAARAGAGVAIPIEGQPARR